MVKNYVWFDALTRNKNGKLVPFRDFTVVNYELKDQELIWMHEGYGRMNLYRVHKIDDENYDAELINGCGTYTWSKNWDSWRKNPQLALNARCS